MAYIYVMHDGVNGDFKDIFGRYCGDLLDLIHES